jgi:hypothetical protein
LHLPAKLGIFGAPTFAIGHLLGAMTVWKDALDFASGKVIEPQPSTSIY